MIKFPVSCDSQDFIRFYLRLWSLKQHDDLKLTHKEIELATQLICSENENPYHGPERKRIMAKLGMQSANFTVFLKSLIKKGIVNKSGKRDYSVNYHFKHVLDLFYNSQNINVTYQFKNEEYESLDDLKETLLTITR